MKSFKQHIAESKKFDDDYHHQKETDYHSTRMASEESQCPGLPKGHTMYTNAGLGDGEDNFGGRHSTGGKVAHSHTSFEPGSDPSHKEVHAEVVKQNPHLSAEHAAVASKAIHKWFTDNPSVDKT